MLSTSRLVRKAAAVLVATASIVALTAFGSASTSLAAPSRTDLAAVETEASSSSVEELNKCIAVQVITQLFDEGNLQVANQYVRANLVQHNPVIADGREAFKNHFRDLRAAHPNQKYNVKRVLARGNLVMVHANPIHEPGARGMAVMSFFRFDNGMIAEYWETGQDVPATTANGNDMFNTVSYPQTNQPSGPPGMTATSEQLVMTYFTTLLVNKNPDAVSLLWPDLQQHNPNVPNGTEGLREQFAEFFRQFPNVTANLKRIVADREYVTIHFHYRFNPEDRGQSIMGIFRVEKRNGETKIIEHWSVAQEIPATSANNNTMF